MLYQLPSGKVLHLSVEEYLSLSDRELHELTNSGGGSEPSTKMYYGKRAKAAAESDMQSEEPCKELDYTPDIEETGSIGPLDINSLGDE